MMQLLLPLTLTSFLLTTVNPFLFLPYEHGHTVVLYEKNVSGWLMRGVAAYPRTIVQMAQMAYLYPSVPG